MRIGKRQFGINVLKARIYQVFSLFSFVPFGFYKDAVLVNGKIPHPFRPRGWRDLVLNKMMFPDNITRAVVADKIAARGWAAGKIGQKHIAPVYDICQSVSELAKGEYPFPYVVKPNHSSGCYALVTGEKDKQAMLKTAAKWDMDDYRPRLEWAYRDIQSSYIVEKMLVSETQPDTIEYKCFCFFGEPYIIRYWKGREGQPSKIFVDPDWQKMDVVLKGKDAAFCAKRPQEFDNVKMLARILSAEFDFVRVDFMILDGNIYFSEMTNFPTGGTMQFQPHDFDVLMMSEYTRLRKEQIAILREKYSKTAIQSLAGLASEK